MAHALEITKQYLNDLSTKIDIKEIRFSISSDNIEYDDDKKDFWDDIFKKSLEKVGWSHITHDIYEEIKCVLASYYYAYKKDTSRLHWIADMGHGTLDIVVFRYTEVNDTVNVFITSVKQNGHGYHQDKNFKENVKKQFFDMYLALEQKRDSNAPEFRKPDYKNILMPLIITGGGGMSHKKLFKNSLQSPNHFISDFSPVPLENIDFDTNTQTYEKSRFAVLYGLLTYEVEDLELKEPHKIRDIEVKPNGTGDTPLSLRNSRKRGYRGD